MPNRIAGMQCEASALYFTRNDDQLPKRFADNRIACIDPEPLLEPREGEMT
jgi:hypothetical protein